MSRNLDYPAQKKDKARVSKPSGGEHLLFHTASGPVNIVERTYVTLPIRQALLLLNDMANSLEKGTKAVMTSYVARLDPDDIEKQMHAMQFSILSWLQIVRPADLLRMLSITSEYIMTRKDASGLESIFCSLLQSTWYQGNLAIHSRAVDVFDRYIRKGTVARGKGIVVLNTFARTFNLIGSERIASISIKPSVAAVFDRYRTIAIVQDLIGRNGWSDPGRNNQNPQNSGNPFGTGAGNPFGTGNSNPFGTGTGNPFGTGNSNPFGQDFGNPFSQGGPGAGNPNGQGNGSQAGTNPFGQQSGNPFGLAGGNPFSQGNNINPFNQGIGNQNGQNTGGRFGRNFGTPFDDDISNPFGTRGPLGEANPFGPEGPFDFGPQGAADGWGVNALDAFGKGLAGLGALVVAGGRAVGGPGGVAAQAVGGLIFGAGVGISVGVGTIKDDADASKGQKDPNAKPDAPQPAPQSGGPSGYPKPDDTFYPQPDGSGNGGPAGVYSIPNPEGGPVGPLFIGFMPREDGGPMGPKSFNVNYITGPYAEGAGTDALITEFGNGSFAIMG